MTGTNTEMNRRNRFLFFCIPGSGQTTEWQHIYICMCVGSHLGPKTWKASTLHTEQIHFSYLPITQCPSKVITWFRKVQYCHLAMKILYYMLCLNFFLEKDIRESWLYSSSIFNFLRNKFTKIYFQNHIYGLQENVIYSFY